MAGSLEKQFVDRAAGTRAGVTVFSPETAIEVVGAAKHQGVPVHGLDAFLLHPEGKIQPDMEYDLSTGDHEACIAHLRRFIGTSFYFEVTSD